MIVPLSTAVDEEVYKAVSAICGEEVALQLCYSDPEEIQEIKNVINIITNGVRSGRK
ncbi:hypothetical protein [Paenibacillus sp. LjRoot56]|uniref:hypothetical protein n=1 Tax=Paenibacillus sp. LjRoot56 TaxID=3342333 RepID=UPI003ECE2FDC